MPRETLCYQKTLLVIGLITLFVPGQVVAEDSERPWGASVSSGFYTDYMFRGKNVYEGTSIQPSVTTFYDFGELGTLGANLWLHVPGETNEPPEKYTELDTTFSYHLNISYFEVGGGFILYRFPDGDGRIKDTNEYFLSVSADVLLNPSFTFYDDYDEGEYQYYTLTLRETVPAPMLGDDFEFTPYVLFGFASNADDGPVFYEDDGLVHIDTGLSLNLELGIFYIVPNFNFTFEIEEGAENEFWLGVDIGFDI